jgi:hypothetical protein
MWVDAPSLRTERIAALRDVFREHLYDREALIALHETLADRSTWRARRLRRQIRDQLASAQAVRLHPLTWISKSKPWYRRGGIVVSVAGIAVVCVGQGMLRGVGLDLWEPIWRRLQDLMALVPGS